MRFLEGFIPSFVVTALSVSGAVTNRSSQGGAARQALPARSAGAAEGAIQDIRGPVEILSLIHI